MSNTKENFFQDINPSSEMVEAASNQEQEVKQKLSLMQRLKKIVDVSCFGNPVEWQKNERNERKLPF